MRHSDSQRRLYKACRPDGETAWVDHDELWRLQQGLAEKVRRDQARRRRIAVAALCGLVALVVAGVVYRLRPPAGVPPLARSAPVPPPVAGAPPAAPSAAAAESEAPAARAGSADPAAAAESGALAASGPMATPAAATAGRPPVPTPAERVESAVRAWADAWASQDVAAYLASYAAEFEPPDGLSRPEWVSLRRRRVLDRTWIRLAIEGLEIERRGAGRAEARFRQSYSSPSYSDVVRKTLELVEDGGDWRIVAERSSAP